MTTMTAVLQCDACKKVLDAIPGVVAGPAGLQKVSRAISQHILTECPKANS